MKKNSHKGQIEAEGWGLSRKILFIVFVIIVLFTVILSLVVGMKSSHHLRNQSHKNLGNMGRIFRDNIATLVKDIEHTAILVLKDQEMNWRIRGLTELGPFYYLEKNMVGERRMDSELALFLAAQLNIVSDLKVLLGSGHIGSVSVYLGSPFEKKSSQLPVLAVKVNRENIIVGRFDTIGSTEPRLYYSQRTKEYTEPSPDRFKVDSIFSHKPDEFFQQSGFMLDQHAPEPGVGIKLPKSDTLHSQIITTKQVPVIRTWSPIRLQLAEPATLEDKTTTVGWLLLETPLDKSFMVEMGKKLGVNSGVITKDGILISKQGVIKYFKLHEEKNYLDIDDSIHTYALNPVKLANVPGMDALQVVTYSPVTELAQMTGEMYQYIFISACVIILLSTIIVYMAVTSIIHRPLNYLMEGVEQLKKGKLDHRVEVETVDELGYLSQAFNEMSAEIKEKSDDLINTLQDLRLTQSYVRNIIDSMPSILIGVNVKGQVTQWNNQASEVTGISAEQAQGCLLEDIIPQMAIEVERISHAIHVRKPEMELRKPMEIKGESRVTDVAIYPLSANGVAGAVIRVDDVTERVRLQEMMIQSEKMLSVGGLAAGMAHEINNPLAGILQNLQVVQNRFKTDMPKNQRAAVECGTEIKAIDNYLRQRDVYDMLDAVRKSGLRASKIVENMLSFSRKSESRYEYHYLSALIDTTIELAGSSYDLKKKYDFRKINIKREYEKGLPEIPCDKVKIQQVILNILENGAQALSNIKSEQHEPCFYIRLFREGEMARLEIEDNGSGMGEKVVRRIFEPFFTTKEVGQGTGLGLSVSYFIITENHNGMMNVESKENEGTIFIIKLPLASANMNR